MSGGGKRDRLRTCLRLLAALGVGGSVGPALAPAAAPASSRYNILLIVLDDANDWISPLGHAAKTPHLQRLAGRGTVFTRAYCAAPGCGPSRTALLTGMSPASSGIYFNSQPFRRSGAAVARAVSLPAHFRAHGYVTAAFGKIFHHGEDERDGWEPGLYEPAKGYGADLSPHLEERVSLGRIWPYEWGLLPDTWDRDDPERMQDDTRHARRMAEFVGRRHDRPFFAALGIVRPHVPWFAPRRCFELYPLDRIEWPPGVREGDLDDVPAPGRWLARTNVTPDTHRALLERDLWRSAIRAYLAAMSYADEQVGRVLEACTRGPNAGNTLIVVCGDHGYHLGEKEHWNKFTLWERSARVPLLLAVPGQAPRRLAEPISLLDLYPTLLGLCGLPPPGAQPLEGVDLAPLLAGRTSNRGAPVLTTYGRENHTLRDARWRYVRYRDGSEELYDHDADPHEWHNLAATGPGAEVIARLRPLLPRSNAASAPSARERGGVVWLAEAVFGPP